MLALVADIGGTKSQFAVVDEHQQLGHIAYFKNDLFGSFDQVLKAYLALLSPVETIEAAVIAVAGPVDFHAQCELTNVNWRLSAHTLEKTFGFKHVQLVNDLEATAWAMVPGKNQPKFSMLRGQSIDFNQPVLIASPGTGFGQIALSPQVNGYSIHATEGGHKTIAPFNAKMADLIHTHWQQHNTPISWENWFSGSGLHRFYEALFPGEKAPSNETLGAEALKNPTSKAAECMTLFTQGVYAEIGNLSLQYLSWGGVIIAGGIPPKIRPLFEAQENIAYIQRKSEYVSRLENIPVAMCEQTDAPLLGAANYFHEMM